MTLYLLYYWQRLRLFCLLTPLFYVQRPSCFECFFLHVLSAVIGATDVVVDLGTAMHGPSRSDYLRGRDGYLFALLTLTYSLCWRWRWHIDADVSACQSGRSLMYLGRCRCCDPLFRVLLPGRQEFHLRGPIRSRKRDGTPRASRLHSRLPQVLRLLLRENQRC